MKRPPSTGAERFELLAGAVAGRRVPIVAGDDGLTYSDGERIYASRGDPGPIRDLFVVQAALLGIGSLQPRVLARVAGRPRLRRRYLTLEAARAARELRELLPRGVAERIAELYDGPVAESAEASLAHASARGEEVPEAPDWMGTIRPTRVMLASPGLGGGRLTDEQLATASGQHELPGYEDEEDTEQSGESDSFRPPATSSKLIQAFQRLVGIAGSPSVEHASGGDELPVGFRAVGHVGQQARPVTDIPDVRLNLDGPPVGRLYPEYNLHAGRYRERWCAVTEYDPRPREDAPRVEGGEDRRLRRELGRLGLTHERHRRQQEGDGLDLSALIEFVVDRRSGLPGDRRVYELQRRTAHDLGVLVLLDTSGSTGESDAGHKVFDEQRELAARLTGAFDELGDRVAAYGFQSWGRHRVEFLRVKGFDDRYDHTARQRLAALEPGGFTRLGAAIRHATYLLSNRAGTSSTLLIVVGDGLPYDDAYEQRYAEEDCRRALQEAVLAGVGCACLSVRSSTEPAVIERVWGNVPHRSLERPSQLAGHAAALFRDALKEAAASRRVVGARASQGQ